jgi:hypothetical protein
VHPVGPYYTDILRCTVHNILSNVLIWDDVQDKFTRVLMKHDTTITHQEVNVRVKLCALLTATPGISM